MNSLSTVGLLRVKEVPMSRSGWSTLLGAERGLLELRLVDGRGLVGSLLGMEAFEPQRTLSLTSGTSSLPSAPG